MELESILDDEENHRLEFKQQEALTDNHSVAKQLVSFGNREGGSIIYGITDEGEIEGATIDEDLHSVIVSSLARTKCDPPVQFKHRYYSDIEIDGNKGDVFILDVEPGLSSPHALIKGGEGQTREYYIRTGSESRPIKTSQEIDQLFSRDIDPEFSRRIHVQSSFTESLSTAESTPQIPNLFSTVFGLLSEEDKEILTENLELREDLPRPYFEEEEDSPILVKLIKELMPFVLWHGFVYWQSDKIPSRDPYFERLELKDFKIDHDGDILDSVLLDESQLTQFIGERSAIRVPQGTEGTISCGTDDEDNKRSYLSLEKQDHFDIRFYCQYPMNALRQGTPGRYPGYLAPDLNSDNILSFQGSIVVTGDFAFPDSEDPQITNHVMFKDALIEFSELYDWDTFLDECANKAIYDIQRSVEELQRELL